MGDTTVLQQDVGIPLRVVEPLVAHAANLSARLTREGVPGLAAK
jgi:hypothetical protein